MTSFTDQQEWLEPDGLGGFASGTASTIRTRRYHALLLPATTPPTGRMVLLGGLEVWATTASGRYGLSTQRYAPGVEYPGGRELLVSFVNDPWPTWRWRLPDGTEIEQELFVPHGRPAVALSWRAVEGDAVMLEVRPLLAARDYHSLQHENGALRFEPATEADALVWRVYEGVPALYVRASGEYAHEPVWYRQFLYSAEAERGLDAIEDLASPGTFRFDLATGPALLLAGTSPDAVVLQRGLADTMNDLRTGERARRAGFESPLLLAADAYFVTRGSGRTLIAGYPWFTDWGRDTFIALRGLGLATRRLEEARDILTDWAGTVSEGMLPNRFPDAGGAPEYNSVDASLWYVIAVDEFLATASASGLEVSDADRGRLEAAVAAIVEGYAAGTRYGIRQDADGLLASGTPGVQLTWMDAKVGDWVVTPRTGKAVEVQALWYNALLAAGRRNPRWAREAARVQQVFADRFWNRSRGCLYDVVDVDHVGGRLDATLRPNQILAVGGLPAPLVAGDMAAQIVSVVESELLTPLGLRSLAPGEPGYRAHYGGGPFERDSAYHQGTVWPWLIGAYVDAWLAVHGDTPDNRDAVARILEPLDAHLADAGLGHVSEIADAEAPFTPRGCPFQAWSLGELIRARERIGARNSQLPTPNSQSRLAGLTALGIGS